MNPETGELRRMRAEAFSAMPEGFEPVPAHLERAAQLKLADADRAQINLLSSHPLARWAAERRAAKKRKAKIAAASRRRNRK